MTGPGRARGAIGRLFGQLGRKRRGAAGSASGPQADGEPTIVYSPELDGEPDPGEIVWAWVPYEDDPNQGKDRPVLVIGWTGGELAAVPLSSKDHAERADRSEWIEVGTGGWDRQGRPSYADAGRLLHVAPGDVRREGAILARPRFDAVVDRVRTLHRWRG